ncbi:hypothetical protein H9P43_003155 [Blastocladiella emersonii ATCC 22665]|nr:hypothetical protein H9P43_003155 [Blastocladiella emersonii ATCC 22665]
MMTVENQTAAAAPAAAAAPDTAALKAAATAAAPAPKPTSTATLNAKFAFALRGFLAALQGNKPPTLPADGDLPPATPADLAALAASSPTVPAPDAVTAQDLRRMAALSLDDVNLEATYQLIFSVGIPATAHPQLMYALLALGFQIDDFATVLGSLAVDVRYRGLPLQVVAEITDAPTTVALLSSFREGEKAAAEEKVAEEEEKPELEDAKAEGCDDEALKVDDRDRLYHVEVDLSQRSWEWSWSTLRYLPGLESAIEI